MTIATAPKEKRMTAASPTVAKTAAAAPIAMSPCVAPAIVTGLLLWAGHFPLSWGWLSWVALVPVLTLTRAQASGRRILWSAFLAGMVFFVPALQWIRVADPRMYAAWVFLAAYCAAYFPLGLWVIRHLDRRGVPMVVSVPAVWIGLEWVRSFAFTGFAWYFLGHAQHRFDSLIQLADFGGVYAVSFLVAAVNGWLVDLAFRLPPLRDRFRWTEQAASHLRDVRPSTSVGLWARGAILAGMIATAVVYGHWRIDQSAFSAGPRVAMLQTNIPQSVRNGEEIGVMMEIQNTALPYLACLSEPMADLIVWPETSFGFSHVVLDSGLPIDKVDPNTLNAADQMQRRLREFLAIAYPTQHLLGLNTYAFDASNKLTRYSSSLLVDTAGAPTHRFDKIHRVMFGEYVPLVDWLPFMKAFAPYTGQDYSIQPGKEMTRFPLGPYVFGSLVCFEDTDPILARKYAQTTVDGRPVDFFVNQSNDGWFRGTSEHEEHLIVSKFRAIENRRALLRSVNMGVSAVIDPNGRILKPEEVTPERPIDDRPSLDPRVARAQKMWTAMKMWPNIKTLEKARPDETMATWEVLPNAQGLVDELPVSGYSQFKSRPGVLLATVPIDRRVSFYSQWGDWLPMTCFGIVAAILLLRRPRPIQMS